LQRDAAEEVTEASIETNAAADGGGDDGLWGGGGGVAGSDDPEAGRECAGDCAGAAWVAAGILAQREIEMKEAGDMEQRIERLQEIVAALAQVYRCRMDWELQAALKELNETMNKNREQMADGKWQKANGS
jgi:hypothetical protein